MGEGDTSKVSFIQVVPVLEDELDFAARSGTPALLEKMNLEARGRWFGWGRRARDGVLRRRLFGL